MDKSNSSDVSSANAVLLGALASGVNSPTWSMVKFTFLMLGFSFAAMLALAFSSHDFIIVGNVLLLFLIAGALFIFLNSFLAQTGLVSVEQQMEEMGLSGPRNIEEKKE